MIRRVLLTSLLCVSGCTGVPNHEVVGGQGVLRFIVVTPAVAANDAQLFQIADRLRQDTNGQTIQAMFWTDRAAAWKTLPIGEHASVGPSPVATVNINPYSSLREVRHTTQKP